MIRRDVWEKYQFDESVSNIEDRVWGKAVTEAGFKLIYEPDAAVFHHHGLHQGNKIERATGVVSILEQVDKDLLNDLPESALPKNAQISAVIPISKELYCRPKFKTYFEKTLKDLKCSQFVKRIYILTDEKSLITANTVWLDRAKVTHVDDLSFDKILQKSLDLIETGKDFPDALLYVNCDYKNRPISFFDMLILEFQFNGCDTAFAGYEDYSHYWFKDEGDNFVQTDGSFSHRDDREPIYRALYGLGCISSVHNIRKGKMVSGKIGILPLKDERYSLRNR